MPPSLPSGNYCSVLCIYVFVVLVSLKYDLSAKESFGCSRPTIAIRFVFIAGLNFLQHVRTSPEGYAHFTLSGDYYNRALSG